MKEEGGTETDICLASSFFEYEYANAEATSIVDIAHSAPLSLGK